MHDTTNGTARVHVTWSLEDGWRYSLTPLDRGGTYDRIDVIALPDGFAPAISEGGTVYVYDAAGTAHDVRRQREGYVLVRANGDAGGVRRADVIETVEGPVTEDRDWPHC